MKKIYKIIASISVFLIVLFVGVVLVVGNTNKKANAGVIIDESIHYTLTNISTIYANDPNISNDYYYIGVSQAQINSSNGVQIANLCHTQGLTNTAFRVKNFRFDFAGWQGQFQGGGNWNIQGGTPSGFKFDYVPPTTQLDDGIVYLSIQDIFTKIGAIGNNSTIWETNNFTPYLSLYNQAYIKGFFIKESSATIKQVSNIYDLENKCFCLLYLSDISGLATSQMQDEIIINWGFINSEDNTIYSEYSPTISAQNLQANNDTIIRIGVPLNNSGITMNYYDISQNALLSIIDSSQGGATATAHIYGIYVWRNLNMIEWGLAEFDTTSTPTSGASMNYLTSTTRLYQYQNMNTSTMTCRLNVSSNFNFITIKNQEQVDVSSVNAVIRQGGFMPAWALYNWARGSHSGFTSGEQYGAAQYQQGQPGYDAIFQAGRQAGLNENIGTQNWFMKIFQGVDSFLNIRIFPNITFGVLLGIPFVISVVWFIIRSFRGGGGS